MTLETILRKHIDNLDPNNKREYKKKTIELCHIGKLIISIDEGYSIATVGESPDVIIGNNIKKIGLEHVVLIESTQKEREGYLNNFFKLAEEAFSFKYPEKKFLVNIYLKETFPVVPKSQSHELIPQVIQIINEWIETNKMVENELIDHIYHMPFDKLDFEPNNGAWGSGILTNELLIKNY